MGNRYLEGNYAPVTDEVTRTDLEVEGRVPEALQGRYVRSGPNPWQVDDPDNHHWFLGAGMVHGVELRGGRAQSYRNRWVRSPERAEVEGIDPVPSPGGSPFPGSGNTNVIHHAGMLLAINELSLPYELTSELETLRQLDFGGPLPNGTVAHPKFDPVTGEMHVIGYSFAPPYCLYHVIDANGQLIRTEEIPVGGPVMLHDFAITETNLVFFDLPVVFDLDQAMAGVGLPYRWDPEYAPRVGVMPRSGTGVDTKWCDVEPCYVFHPLNAYDDGDRVVVDLARHPKMFDLVRNGPNEGAPTLDRWTIDPLGGKVTEERVDDRGQEFPRADERLAGRRHRYGYTMGLAVDDRDVDFGGNAILKHDFDSGTTEAHQFDRTVAASEFVFVPEAPDSAEDAGWLLGYAYDADRDASDLVVLDARDVAAPAVATVHLPVRVPFGFHGNWIPDAALR